MTNIRPDTRIIIIYYYRMREFCPHCSKTINACYCHKITKFNNLSKIIILQHPSETKHALNTARIAALSFKNCEIITGEDFTLHNRLNSILQANDCYLLFPSDAAQTVSAFKEKQITLIVLDGSWKKAKKIFYLSKNLHSLPKLQLPSGLKSRYRLRKQPTSGFLSTIEAITYSLNTIEGKDYSKAFLAFDYMIEYQIKKMGAIIYKQNYQAES